MDLSSSLFYIHHILHRGEKKLMISNGLMSGRDSILWWFFLSFRRLVSCCIYVVLSYTLIRSHPILVHTVYILYL